MRLSVLDQSPVMSGLGARRAIEETLALARRADELGYHRYWLAEHHAIAALADPCPEVLLARLGAETKRIRVGTGGVLLPYYSAFRVAETFRMLEALYPGRIDLGIGRAPGGSGRTAQAVGGGAIPDARHFPEQVWTLLGLLGSAAQDSALQGVPRGLPDEHPFKRVRLQPEVDTAPQIWLLGSSDFSGALAAQLGLPFAFAHFINPHGGDAVARSYRETFSAKGATPRPSASRRRSTCGASTWRSTSTRRSPRRKKPRGTSIRRRRSAMSWGSAPARSSAARPG
jgi:luciferase family oxidoreductase group 1